MSHFFHGDFGTRVGGIFTDLLAGFGHSKPMNISGTIHPTHFKHGKIYDPVNSQAAPCCIGAVDVMLKPGKCRFFFGQWEYPDTRPGCGQSAGYGETDLLLHVHVHAGLAMLRHPRVWDS